MPSQYLHLRKPQVLVDYLPLLLGEMDCGPTNINKVIGERVKVIHGDGNTVYLVLPIQAVADRQ